MCDSPGFTKPTHGYGLDLASLPAGNEDSPEAAVYDEDWAGEGFDQPYEEPECNLCPTPCAGCDKWERRAK